MIRKKLIIPAIIIIIVFLIIAGIIYLVFKPKPEEEKPSPFLPKEKTMEEILKDLTASSEGEKVEVSEETIKSLTAPGQGEVSEEIIKNLTAPK